MQDRIRTALDKVGTKNGTACPAVTVPHGCNDTIAYANKAIAAYELFVAHTIRSYANARWTIAKANANNAGVLDEANEVAAGTLSVVYDDPFTVVTMRVAKSSAKIDCDLLLAELLKAGVKDAILNACVHKATVLSTPARTITPTTKIV